MEARRAYESMEGFSFDALRAHVVCSDPAMAAIRQRAAEYIQDRLYGKPMQAIAVDTMSEADKLKREELAAIAKAVFAEPDLTIPAS